MVDAIEFEARGIKCDAVGCDYSDMEAEFIPELYLNAPCPLCGANLFTLSDLKAMRKVLRRAKFLNWLLRPFLKNSDEARTRFELKMNGTGKIEVTEGDKNHETNT